MIWFALKIIAYLLAACAILAWCAVSWRRSRRRVEEHLRSLPADEVQALADRAGNTYEQCAWLARKFGAPVVSAAFHPDHPDRLPEVFGKLDALLDTPLPQDVVAHIMTVFRAMEDDTLVAYTLRVRFQNADETLVVAVRAKRESLSGTYLLDPATGELAADDWVRNPAVFFFSANPRLIDRLRA